MYVRRLVQPFFANKLNSSFHVLLRSDGKLRKIFAANFMIGAPSDIVFVSNLKSSGIKFYYLVL